MGAEDSVGVRGMGSTGERGWVIVIVGERDYKGNHLNAHPVMQ